MLLSKTVKTKWNGRLKQYYINKGYVYTKIGDEFEIKVEDLTIKSAEKVEVKCDCKDCKNPVKFIKWYNYKRYLRDDGKYYCNICATKLFASKKSNLTKLSKSKSFEQWCLENNRQDVLDRWDYEKNIDKNGAVIKPDEIGYSTNKRFWFECSKYKHHKSELKYINSFTRGQEGSVFCNQCNSFEQWCYDNLSKEEANSILSRWDYNKNIDKDGNVIKPNEIGYANNGFNKKGFWFKCDKHLEHKSELKSIDAFTRYKKVNMGSIECSQCSSLGQYLLDTYGENGIKDYWSNKNIVDPFEIGFSSHTKVWFKCNNKEKPYHEDFYTSCNCFTKTNQQSCPYCINQKIHPLDSLGKLLEDEGLLYLWSEKNKKSPYEYAPYSSKKAWWKCSDGTHDDFYKVIGDFRNRGNFHCPKCSRERNESYLQEKVRLYLNELGYTVLHENECYLKCINPKTNYLLRYDNEVVELNLIIEVHGQQHYDKNAKWINDWAKKKGFTKEEYLRYGKVVDRYKRIYAKSKGYYYLEIPYWADNKKENWKRMINNKIDKIKNNNELRECI